MRSHWPAITLSLALAACDPHAADGPDLPDLQTHLHHGEGRGITATIERTWTPAEASPEKRAIIHATDGQTSARFTVFLRDGRWHFEEALELDTDGTPQTGPGIHSAVRTIALRLRFHE